MVQFLSPGIKVREQQAAIRNIRGVATSIACFVGLAIKGPIGEPILITSLADFVDIFGGPTQDSVLFHAVDGFYRNAGEGAPAYIVRTAHYTTISDPNSLTAASATVTLQDGAPADTLVVDAKSEGVHGNRLSVSAEAASKFQTEINIAAGLNNGATYAPVKNPAGIRIGTVLNIDDGVDSAIVVVTSVENNNIYFDALSGLTAAIDDGATVSEVSFNLTVYSGGEQVEFWPNLSMEDTNSKDYVEVIINDANTGSQYITVTDDDSATGPGLDLPDQATPVNLSGGDDGLVDLTDGDFVGSSAASNGLYAFDSLQVVNMLAIPDSQTQVAHQGLIDYAELRQFALAILDSPRGLGAQAMVTYVEDTLAANSSRAATFYPQLKVYDPDSDSNIIVPPSGHIMGIYARVDGNEGVQQVGAGELGIIRGIVGFETDVTEKLGVRDILYPSNINPLARIEGLGRVVFGSRTLSLAGGIGSQINERRVFNFVEQSLFLGLKFVLFKNNTPEFRRTVENTITAFLVVLQLDGVLESFYVDVGEGLNNALVRATGKLVALVGLKAPDTIEFFELITTKDTRAQEQALAELAT